MPTAAQLQMIALDELTYPVSARYQMLTSFGWTQQDLHFDIPVLNENPDHTAAVLWEVWRGIVAPATTASTTLQVLFWVAWHAGPLAMPYIGPAARGMRLETPARRADTGVLLLHSGHEDDNAARRLFISGMPIGWQSDGQLTGTGWDGLSELAHGISMGASAHFMGGEMQLLHAYPGAVTVAPENLSGVAFRRISHLRVVQHTAKAPDLSLGLWP